MEYKFKGQRIDNNEFITGSIVVDEIADKYYITLSVEENGKTGEEGCLKVVSCEVKKETISASTGVKDINKKESYLGDILKEPVYQYSSKKDIEKRENSFGIVKKYKNSNNFYLEWNFKRKFEGRYFWDTNELPITHIERYEIVGNIYENPDMIKKEE